MATKRATEMLEDAAKALGCTASVADIRGERRARAIAWDRFLVARLLREEEQMSYPELGRLIGGRDHATMMSAVRRAAEIVERHAGIAGRWMGAALRYRNIRATRPNPERTQCPECQGAGTVDAQGPSPAREAGAPGGRSDGLG